MMRGAFPIQVLVAGFIGFLPLTPAISQERETPAPPAEEEVAEGVRAFAPDDPWNRLPTPESLHRQERLNGGAIGELFKAKIGDAIQSVIPLESPDGRLVAFATAVSENGYALTKASEIEPFEEPGPQRLTARLGSGKNAAFRLAAMQKENDIALIKIEARLRPIEWESSDALKTGFWVSAVAEQNHSVEVGIVSTPPRPIEREGGVVGIKIHAREGRGVLIWHVFESSGAAEAGLKSGDVVLFVAGKPVNSPDEFTGIVTRFDANESVELVVERQVGGKTKKWAVEVMLGYRREVTEELDRNELLSGASSRRRAGFQNVIQHDIPLGPESMGGPFFTIEGRAVGLNIARRDRVTTFALPSELVDQLFRAMIASVIGQAPAEAPSDEAKP